MASPHPVSITLTTTAGLTGPMTREKAAIRAEASTVLRSREGMA